MPKLVRFSACFASILLLAHCSSNSASDDDSSGANNGAGAGTPASGGTGGGTGGTAASTGGAGGTTAGTGNASGGTGGTTGGTRTGTGGSTGGTGGSTGGTGGSTGGAGGTTGGTAGAPGGMGGTSGAGGSVALGGMGGTGTLGGMGGMDMGGSGPIVDPGGMGLAKPGDQKSGSGEYINLGDMRLLNNKWGSDELNCSSSQYKVFVNNDKSLGWQFNRPTCGGSAQKPDYPEIEFGVHPFGAGSSLATSPDYSSTALLPIQASAVTSASVTLDNFAINLQGQNSWNIDCEFWLSERNPVTDPNPGVYAELIVFWGWENGRWPEPPNGTGPTGNGAGDQVSAGNKTYKLEVQSDSWGSGWRYFQFRATDGPQNGFSGKIDIKALMDYLTNKRGYSKDLWLTRIEVGSEIDDNTSGSVSIKNITFEVNGTSKSPQFAQ